MNHYLQIFRNNIPLISLFFYLLGYSYLSVFYYQYGIEIHQYVNLLDIFFTAVNSLTLVVITYVIVDVLIYLVSVFVLKVIFACFRRSKITKDLDSANNIKRIKEVENEFIANNVKETDLTVFFLGSISLIYFSDEKWVVMSLFILFLIIKLYRITSIKTKEERSRLQQGIGILLGIALFLCFLLWGYIDGSARKVKKGGKKIEFVDNDISYNTASDSLAFIGETNSFLFIYDNKNRATLIFNKSNISNLKIKDQTLTLEEKVRKNNETKQQVEDLFKKYKR